MKNLTDKKKALRITLQSLPAALAAIVFLIYGATFMPLSTAEMERSVTLVECVSYYELLADGRPAAYFKSMGGGMSPEGMSPVVDSTVKSKSYATACWVNRWPLLPSCKGLLLTANGDSTAEKRLPAANRSIQAILRKAIDDTAERIRQLGRMEEEAGYYMRTHNVNDDGYNVMAAYTAGIEADRRKAEGLLSALENASKRKRLAVRLVTEYTLISADTAGTAKRTACRILTTDRTKPLRLLQTADKRTPDGAAALYLHQWMTPRTEAGDSVIIASYPGCTRQKYAPAARGAHTFGGAAKGGGRHDVPPLLAPDGSAVFTASGRFAGISIGGRTVNTACAGFGLKHLLP